MVESNKGHACIFMWSLGSEAGVGPTQLLMRRWVGARDPFVTRYGGSATATPRASFSPCTRTRRTASRSSTLWRTLTAADPL